ncbi:MAG: hypothetical protein JW841_09375 [Deltaproteobacteria bacterium]|nr:hypothetical protein [Deltaproteobacteria bacterium]
MGAFQCLKVKISVIGWRGLFWEAFYYITNDKHRNVVKIKNIPDSGVTELVSIEYPISNQR